MNGRFASGRIGFGTVVVRGRSLVPSPPTRMSACTIGSGPSGASDSFVYEPGGASRFSAQEVAAVDDHRIGHLRANLFEVELAELRPFGHDHGRVRSVERL